MRFKDCKIGDKVRLKDGSIVYIVQAKRSWGDNLVFVVEPKHIIAVFPRDIRPVEAGAMKGE